MKYNGQIFNMNFNKKFSRINEGIVAVFTT